jgi:hypothetical protein
MKSVRFFLWLFSLKLHRQQLSAARSAKYAAKYATQDLPADLAADGSRSLLGHGFHHALASLSPPQEVTDFSALFGNLFRPGLFRPCFF